MEKKDTRMLAKQFKNTIIKDMASLNGTQFEDLCKVVLCMIINADEIQHKGCNLNGKPVSYAVDMKTENCRIVGQSGTNKDYFTKRNFVKPMGDIHGTKRNNPLCEVLYLFSNQCATDAQHTGLITKINKEILSFKVNVYDAEKIAEIIYDNVDNPTCNDVWQYLTESYQFYAIFPKRNCIPQSSRHYIHRTKESIELKDLLKKQQVVDIVGVSGIGKSEFAKQVAKEICLDFDSLLWINGCDYENLDAVKICQFDYYVNLRFVLENYKSLIIVDNLNESVSDFSEAFQNANKHDSKCIITSLKQGLKDEQTYKLPYMDEELIEMYINKYDIDLSETDIKGLVALVAGYPLAINMICSLVKNGFFQINDLLADGALQEVEDEHNQRLSERIIGKIYNQYAEELNQLAYINSLNISSEFLKEIFKSINLRYLCLYSILQQDNAYTFRIHQVVLDAIKCIAEQPDIRELTNKLTVYLDKKNRQKDIPFFTLFRHNNSFIDKIYNNKETSGKQKKVILYSRFQAENTFSNQFKYLSSLKELTLQPAKHLYDCLLLVDRNEIELSATNKSDFNEKAQIMISRLGSVLASTTNEDIKFELLHHIGKLYVKLRDEDNAIHYFEQALAIRPKAYATLLQLAKITKSNISKVKEYLITILDDNITGHNVPLTIILACYSLFLSKKQYEDLAEKYIENDFDNFSKVIMNSLVAFNNQAVPTLASLAYPLTYKNPEFMRMAIELLQELQPASSDKAYIQACAILKAVEYKLEEDKRSDNANLILVSAKYYFELLALEKKGARQNNDYLRKRYQELLMDAGEWEAALKISNCFDNKNSEFFYQNLAKIYQGLLNFDTAIDYINKAISKASDTDYRSSFIYNKACILHDMGNRECIQVLQDAICMRKENKAKNEWMKMEKIWEKEIE